MKLFKAIAKFFKSIGSAIKNHFEKRGVVNGVKDIVEVVAATGLAVAVGKATITRLRLYWETRGKRRSNYNAPIDVIRENASELEKARKNKADLKKAKKEDREIRHEAVERLSKHRDKYFHELPYKERRSILEVEGHDLQEMEQMIRVERRVDAKLKEINERRERFSNSAFQRFQRLVWKLVGAPIPETE